MFKFFKMIMAACLSLGLVAGATASTERATKPEAIKMMDDAFAHIKKVGQAKAWDDFTNDKANWVKKDLYIFVMDLNAVILGHGANVKQIGKNMWEVKDPNGVLLAQEMVKVGKGKGEGWVDYQWTDPLTKKLADKTTLIRRVPGTDIVLGIGIYK